MKLNSCYSSFVASFVAPSYIPYVLHVLKDAESRGINRLYFVSRDAYILQKIAEQINQDGIEFRYLFISRASLEDAFFHIATEKERIDTGLQSSFKTGISYKEGYDLTIGYLRQEGIFDDNIALVDVGWFGRTRAMINCFRRKEGKCSLFCYYYGVHQVRMSKEYGDYDYYIKKPLHPEWSTYIIEEYFSLCPYPTTIGYMKDKKETFQPVFPKGEHYIETPFVKVNVDICKKLTKELLLNNLVDNELYAMMQKAHNKLFYSSYVSKHKEFYPIFNDHYKSIYCFGVGDLMNVIKGVQFDYRVNVRTNIELAVGTLGYNIINFLKKVYIMLDKLKYVLK